MFCWQRRERKLDVIFSLQKRPRCFLGGGGLPSSSLAAKVLGMFSTSSFHDVCQDWTWLTSLQTWQPSSNLAGLVPSWKIWQQKLVRQVLKYVIYSKCGCATGDQLWVIFVKLVVYLFDVATNNCCIYSQQLQIVVQGLIGGDGVDGGKTHFNLVYEGSILPTPSKVYSFLLVSSLACVSAVNSMILLGK